MNTVTVRNLTFELLQSEGGKVADVESDNCNPELLAFIQKNFPTDVYMHNIREVLTDLINGFNKK